MSKTIYIAFSVIMISAAAIWYVQGANKVTIFNTEESAHSFTEEEVGFESEPAPAEMYRIGAGMTYTLEELRTWERPDGPLRVGVQVGHLRNDEVPEELEGLRRNGAGATAAGYNERDTVEVIATQVAEDLEAVGIVVDLLPATVPPGYVADAFVSIHADGNPNTSVRGFKIAGPRRDYSGQSEALVAALYDTYEAATNLPIDENISRRMTAYYAFNWPRYEYAVHPYTPSVIVETGFLTNPADRTLLLEQPAVVAAGISTGIQRFLEAEVPPRSAPTLLEAPTLPLSGTVVCARVRAGRRDRDERPCEAALRDEAGNHFMLVQEPAIATSSLPYQAVVSGEYAPIQVLDNYFWFHFEAEGIIFVESLTTQ